MGYRAKLREAEEIVQQAKIRHNKAVATYQRALGKTNRLLSVLTTLQRSAHGRAITNFTSVASRFKNIALTDLKCTDATVYGLSLSEIASISVRSADIEDTEIAAALGIGIGVPTTIVTIGGGGIVVAGGASLAAMIAGVAIPVLGILALGAGILKFFELNTKAEEMLTRAHEYSRRVDYQIGRVQTALAYLDATNKRINEVRYAVRQVESRLKKVTRKLRWLPRNRYVGASRWLCGFGSAAAIAVGIEFQFFLFALAGVSIFCLAHLGVRGMASEIELSSKSKKLLFAGFAFAKYLKALAEVRISENGEYDDQSAKIMSAVLNHR